MAKTERLFYRLSSWALIPPITICVCTALIFVYGLGLLPWWWCLLIGCSLIGLSGIVIIWKAWTGSWWVFKYKEVEDE